MTTEPTRIWLSHVLDEATPLYGGGKGLVRQDDKQIKKGDSCNTSIWKIPSHAGTHVDAPFHFVGNGATIEQYTPDEWIFTHPELVFVSIPQCGLITPDHITVPKNSSTDMILLCTPFESFRDTEVYWKKNPGISPETSGYLKKRCPNLQIIGMNFISISSYCHREIGRQSHRAFLKNGIRIIEDMTLSGLHQGDRLKTVTVLPLRFHQADGAPCTVIAEKGNRTKG